MNYKEIANLGSARGAGLPTYHFNVDSEGVYSCLEDEQLALITYPTSKNVIVEQSVEISGKTMNGSMGSVFTVSVIDEGDEVMITQTFLINLGNRISLLYRGLVDGEVVTNWSVANFNASLPVNPI